MKRSIRKIAHDSCVSANASNACMHCNRKGIAFLPVRYAVARHMQAKRLALPEDRIRSFTDINLKKLVRTDGSWSSKEQTAWYVLRKLRDGYLYIYDEHPIYPHWLCYAVGYNGELTQFSANNPKSAQEVNCNIDINYTISSLVALRDKNTDRTINIVFLEAPFNVERLNEIAEDAAWRANHMRQLKLSQLASSPFSFSEDEIRKYVIEYGDEDPATILKGDLDGGRFSNTAKCADYKIKNLDTFQSLSKAFNSVSGRSVPVCAVAIPDTVGIIKQLDMYRMSSLDEFSKCLKKGDEGADKEHHYIDYTWSEYFLFSQIPGYDWNSRKYDCRYALNERNYKWYLAVNKLKDLMEASLIVKDQDYGEILKFGVPRYYLVDEDNDPRFDSLVLKKYKGLCYEAILYEYDNAKTEADKMLFKEVIDIYKKSWEQKKKNALNKANKAKNEIIEDYVVSYDWSSIKKLFETVYEATKIVSISFDSDYALWVKENLSADLDKYDKDSPLHCACVTEIIADILKNGIISDSSKFLWKYMIDGEYSLLDRGFSINGVWALEEIKKSIAQYNKKDDKKSVITPSGALNKDLTGKIEKNAVKIRDFLSKVSNSDFKAAFEMKKSPILVTLDSLDKLHNTAINSTSSLLINDIEKEVNNGMGVGRGTIAINIRFKNRLLEFHNFGNTINEAIYGRDAAKFKIVEVKMTASQAGQYVKSITKITEGINNNSSGNVKAYDNGESIKGNFQFEDINSKEEVSIYAVLEEDVADRIEKNMKLRGIDAMDGGIKKLYEAQKKTLNKVKFGSSSIIKLGCVYSLISAVHTYSEKKDFSSLWKLISSFLAVIQHLSEVMSFSLTKVAESFLKKSSDTASKLLSEALVKNAETATLWAEGSMIISKGFGHSVSLMAVYDAVKGAAETVDIYNSGGLSDDYTDKAISTGVSFISSVVVGLFISNIFIGALVAVAAIAILFFFDVNRIVPECIQNWLRRSKFGKESGTAPGRPFKNMREEQDNLSMLLKGIVFAISIESEKKSYRVKRDEEVTWGDYLIETASLGGQNGGLYHEKYIPSVLSEETKNVKITLSFPETFDGYIDILGVEEISENVFFKKTYLIDKKGVCSISFSHDGSVNNNVYADYSHLINSSRFKNNTDFISIKKEKDTWYNIKKEDVISVNNIGMNKSDEKNTSIIENENILLEENHSVKKLAFVFNVGSDDEVLASGYKAVLNLGDSRKN